MSYDISKQKRTHVRVTREAFIDCLLATAEAAVVAPLMTTASFARLSLYFSKPQPPINSDGPMVPPSLTFSNTGLEVGGYLWGQEIKNERNRVLLIQRMTPVSAVNRGDDFIERSAISGKVMSGLAKAAAAPWGLIGDFHSHPLITVSKSDIEKHRLFGPSWQDRKADADNKKRSVSLIMSISKKQEKQSRQPRGKAISNAHIQIADYDVWLTAFFARRSSQTTPAPVLKLDFQ